MAERNNTKANWGALLVAQFYNRTGKGARLRDISAAIDEHISSGDLSDALSYLNQTGKIDSYQISSQHPEESHGARTYVYFPTEKTRDYLLNNGWPTLLPNGNPIPEEWGGTEGIQLEETFDTAKDPENVPHVNPETAKPAKYMRSGNGDSNTDPEGDTLDMDDKGDQWDGGEERTELGDDISELTKRTEQPEEGSLRAVFGDGGTKSVDDYTDLGDVADEQGLDVVETPQEPSVDTESDSVTTAPPESLDEDTAFSTLQTFLPLDDAPEVLMSVLDSLSEKEKMKAVFAVAQNRDLSDEQMRALRDAVELTYE